MLVKVVNCILLIIDFMIKSKFEIHLKYKNTQTHVFKRLLYYTKNGTTNLKMIKIMLVSGESLIEIFQRFDC